MKKTSTTSTTNNKTLNKSRQNLRESLQSASSTRSKASVSSKTSTQTQKKAPVKKSSIVNAPKNTKQIQQEMIKQMQQKDGKSVSKQVLKIEDTEINLLGTQQIQKDPKYQTFLEWFKNNGGKMEGIQFPVVFGNAGYLGVAASNNIPANKSFISVPNKMIISTLKINDHEILGPIIDDNPDYFDDEENEDGEFNKLAMFLVYEKIKGEKSYWKPYFDVIQNPVTISQWSDFEIEEFQDPYLKQQAKEYIEELEDTWLKFDIIAEENQNVFPKGSYNRELFIWAFEIVMTRSFGNTLPGSFLVPMADFMNHSKRGSLYFLVNKYRENKEIKKDGYNIKNRSIDLSIIDGLKQTKDQIKCIHEVDNDIISYLEQNQNRLNDDFDTEKAQFLEKEYLLPFVRQINFENIQKNEQQQIWDQDYYSTSEEEDNNSDSEDESLNKNSEFYKIKCRENQELSKKLLNSQNKQCKKIGEDIQITQLKNIQRKEKRETQEKQLQQLQETNWEWYDIDDEENSMNFVTTKSIQKDQQIFICYGRRSNRFLMLWYGFCFLDNTYDSVTFRLLQSWDTQPIEDHNVFIEYIGIKDWDNDKYKYQGTDYSTDNFTKEFKLKKTRLCDDLITFLRVKLLKNYMESDYFNIKVTIPSSFKFEYQVLKIALKFIENLRDQRLITSLDEDGQLLDWPNLPWKQRFAVIYRGEQKDIININIRLLKLAMAMLQQLIIGVKSFKNIYLQKYDIEGENNEELYKLSRECLRDYLRQLYIGIILPNQK